MRHIPELHLQMKNVMQMVLHFFAELQDLNIRTENCNKITIHYNGITMQVLQSEKTNSHLIPSSAKLSPGSGGGRHATAPSATTRKAATTRLAPSTLPGAKLWRFTPLFVQVFQLFYAWLRAESDI